MVHGVVMIRDGVWTVSDKNIKNDDIDYLLLLYYYYYYTN